MSKGDVLATIEEAGKDEVAGLRRHTEVHKMSGNNGAIEEIVSRARSARVLKRRVTKSANQDIRNIMNARVD